MDAATPDPRERLVDAVKERYADNPALAAGIVTHLLTVSERDAALLARLLDTPRVLMLTLETPLRDRGVLPSVNWRGRLQTHLQRRLRRPHRRDEVRFTFSSPDDGITFAATAHVVVPDLRLDVHATGTVALTKQAAVHSAARSALTTLENVRIA